MKQGRGQETKKRGNSLGMAIFQSSLKLFGLSGAYGLLYFVCLYYLVFDRIAVASSMAYIKRRFRSYGFWRRLTWEFTGYLLTRANIS